MNSKHTTPHLRFTTATPSNLGRLWHREGDVMTHLVEHSELTRWHGRKFNFLVRSENGKAFVAKASYIHSVGAWKLIYTPVDDATAASQLRVVMPLRTA